MHEKTHAVLFASNEYSQFGVPRIVKALQSFCLQKLVKGWDKKRRCKVFVSGLGL